MRLVCRDRHAGRSKRPHTHIGLERAIVEKPQGVHGLVAWVVEEAELARKSPPIQLHVRNPHPDKDALPVSARAIGPRRKDNSPKTQLIGGRPFSRPFERYLEGKPEWTPIRRAMRRMFEGGRAGRASLEYRVCWALVEGGYTDLGLLREFLRCSDDTMTQALRDGLDRLWDFTLSEVESDMRPAPLTPAGAQA